MPESRGRPWDNQFVGPNAGYLAELFERFQRDPASVDASTRAYFEAAGAQAAVTATATPSGLVPASLATSAAAGAAALAQAIRLFGHLAVQLDPLGTPPPGDPHLDPATHGIDPGDLSRLSADVVGGPATEGAPDAAEAIRRLRAIYCGTTGYELAHLADPRERGWLQHQVEVRAYFPPTEPIDERGLLDRLTEVSAFERFLQRAYPGATRFSVEGLGMLIPMLDELIDRAADSGVRTILLGMAHRGRLNVLAHVLGKPYERILAEFEGLVQTPRSAATKTADNDGWAGDVKYHAGATRSVEADGVPGGTDGTVTVVMVPNPSHLEFVNPVVEGMARAAGEDRRAGPGVPRQDASALAVLIHGDASFPGQGVVPETLNLSRLAGYSTRGTLHVIANNQLGFTTGPSESRSTLYASDLAKGFEIPVIHVNAQDPVACLAAIRLAVAYRARFQKDILVDLVGYRRWGHNEGDEPSFTQPEMYARIARQPTVREQFGADLVARGVLQPDEPEALLRAGLDEFQRIRESVLAVRVDRGEQAVPPAVREADPTSGDMPQPATAVRLDRLRDLNRALWSFPPDFTLNPKLEKPVQRRRAAFGEDPAAPIDWGHAEALAFATILQDGTPIRLTGQDTVRGTFSQRHAGFVDVRDGEHVHVPLAALPGVSATFEVRNSPLSEIACLGFEYGYTVQAPEALVLWEAQYGDFINGAQVIVDEFVTSGQAKWGLRSGLVLLLPHAWEGQGPDHSSGRLERFLELSAEDNVRVANCTTAAQYFHLLRRQAALLGTDPRPLVLMTPKSLLRHPLAASRAADFTRGTFQTVLGDPRAAARPEAVRRVLLCSGKIWADLVSSPAWQDRENDIAAIRLEELYPFPGDALGAALKPYSRAEMVWVQEEPSNMGAWPYVSAALRELLGEVPRSVGRPRSASPAEGWSDVHAATQRRIVAEALENVAASGHGPHGSGTRRVTKNGTRTRRLAHARD